MAVLVTGSAGFIGFHIATHLLDHDGAVIGLDKLNSYYDVAPKHARLARLKSRRGFAFHQQMSPTSR